MNKGRAFTAEHAAVSWTNRYRLARGGREEGRALTITKVDTHHLVTIRVEDAGRLLGIGRSRSYELAKVGTFPVQVRIIAGQKRVRVIDIERFFDEQTANS